MSYFHPRVDEIRHAFAAAIRDEDFVVDKTGCRMIELVSPTFVADEPEIFGKVNDEYAEREIAWYNSMSLNVNDIPGGAWGPANSEKIPSAWKGAADPQGFINSNYGWVLYHPDNHSQYDNVVRELKANPFSRRAVAIYQRPSMWYEYKSNGRNDFMCTNAVQYLVRKGSLQVVVQMRSNDVVWGYKNDRYWQHHVAVKLAADLGVPLGDIYWNAGSLHVYERHFHLIDWFSQTGETTVTKKAYAEAGGAYK